MWKEWRKRMKFVPGAQWKVEFSHFTNTPWGGNCLLSPPLSVQFSCSVVSDSLRPHGLQHTRLPCPSLAPGAFSNSCPSSRWCHPTISSSVVPFSTLHLRKWGLELLGPFVEVTQRQDRIRFALRSLDADAFKSRSWNKDLVANILFGRGFCDRLIASQPWCTLQYVGEDPLEKEMATHSSTLAWKIPWMEKEPGRLQSMGSQRVGHDWTTSLLIKEFSFNYFFFNRNLLPSFLRQGGWRVVAGGGGSPAIFVLCGAQLWVRGHSAESAHGSKCGPSATLQPRCVDNLCATLSVWKLESEAQLTCSEGLVSPLTCTPHIPTNQVVLDSSPKRTLEGGFLLAAPPDQLQPSQSHSLLYYPVGFPKDAWMSPIFACGCSA